MTYAIAHTARGYQIYRLVNGRYTLNIGPAWPTPREAIRYSDALEQAEAADVSPLRAGPAEDSLIAPVPLAGAVGAESSAGVRRRASPVEDTGS